jgi:hypothetical protein
MIWYGDMSEPRKKEVVHLAKKLRWASEKPAGPGWYWHRGTYRDPDPIIVEVDEAGYFQWPDGSFDDVQVTSGHWAGPIEPPDEDG